MSTGLPATRSDLDKQPRSFRLSCIRCPLLRIDPAQRHRLAAIRENLTARIAEAEQQGWAGEAEDPRSALPPPTPSSPRSTGFIARRDAAVTLGIPAFPAIAGRTTTDGRT